MNKCIEMKTIDSWSKRNGHQKCQNGVKPTTNGNLDSRNLSRSVKPESHLDSDIEQKNVFLACIQRACSWRYVIVFLLHTSFVVAVFARNCMPIALVCMTRTTQPNESSVSHNSSVNGTTSFVGDIGDVTNTEYEFAWDSDVQGLVLSSVSFLSFLAPLFANFIHPIIGYKATLTSATLVCVVLTSLNPVASRLSPWLLIVLRILLGCTFGVNVPVIGDYVARWAPKMEKQTMITIVFTGMQTGGILTFILSGYLCTIPVDNGWPFIFYVIAFINVIWVILWHFLSSSKPENHKYISQKELQYILVSRDIVDDNKKNGATERPPYKTILTSVPVLVFLVCSSAHFWTVNLFFTYQAIFLTAVLKFQPSEVGVLMSTFSTIRFFGMIFWTVVVNRLQRMKKFSNTTVKKIGLSSGMLLTTACQIGIVFQDSSQKWNIIALFFAGMVFQSCGSCILPAVPQDLAPRYAGFITGLFFSCGGLLSVSAPVIVAAITPNNTEEEWRNVWIILLALYVSIFFIFLIFGDSSLQPWAQDSRENPPQVVSPFDPMQKRFSAAFHAPPLSPSRIDRVAGFNFSVEVEKNPNPSIYTVGNHQTNTTPIEGSLYNGSSGEHLEEADDLTYSDRIDNPKQSNLSPGGVVNDGFISDFAVLPEVNTDNAGPTSSIPSPSQMHLNGRQDIGFIGGDPNQDEIVSDIHSNRSIMVVKF